MRAGVMPRYKAERPPSLCIIFLIHVQILRPGGDEKSPVVTVPLVEENSTENERRARTKSNG